MLEWKRTDIYLNTLDHTRTIHIWHLSHTMYLFFKTRTQLQPYLTYT